MLNFVNSLAVVIRDVQEEIAFGVDSLLWVFSAQLEALSWGSTRAEWVRVERFGGAVTMGRGLDSRAFGFERDCPTQPSGRE